MDHFDLHNKQYLPLHVRVPVLLQLYTSSSSPLPLAAASYFVAFDIAGNGIIRDEDDDNGGGNDDDDDVNIRWEINYDTWINLDGVWCAISYEWFTVCAWCYRDEMVGHNIVSVQFWHIEITHINSMVIRFHTYSFLSPVSVSIALSYFLRLWHQLTLYENGATECTQRTRQDFLSTQTHTHIFVAHEWMRKPTQSEQRGCHRVQLRFSLTHWRGRTITEMTVWNGGGPDKKCAVSAGRAFARVCTIACVVSMQIEVDHVMAMNDWMDSQMVDSLCIRSHTLDGLQNSRRQWFKSNQRLVWISPHRHWVHLSRHFTANRKRENQIV